MVSNLALGDAKEHLYIEISLLSHFLPNLHSLPGSTRSQYEFGQQQQQRRRGRYCGQQNSRGANHEANITRYY